MGHDDNYDKLLQSVSKQATLDREKVLAEAKETVRQIEAQTQAEIGQIRNEIEAEAQREIRLEKDRLLGQSQMAFRLARQSSRVRLLRQAFAQAKKDVAALPQSPQYPAILGALIAEALAITGPDSLIKVAASEEKLCRAWIGQQKLSCQMQAIQAESGTVLAFAAQGDRQADNSLATRLARVESLCQQDVAVILFQDDAENRGNV
jgi:vacuolar-type H+-ATPase subunit E/Vma4